MRTYLPSFMFVVSSEIVFCGSPHSAVFDLLFDSYNRQLTPPNRPVTVKQNAVLTTIDELDERNERITVSLWLHTFWSDERLVWQPDRFDNITHLQVPLSLLWVADFYIYGLDSLSWLPASEETFITVSFSGSIHLTRSLTARLHCPVDVSSFPFDTQRCTLRLSSWAHTIGTVKMQCINDADDHLSNYKRNTEWTLDSFTCAERTPRFSASGNRTYSQLVYGILLHRQSNYYMLTQVLPTFMIITLSLLGLFSPFAASGVREEKVTMGLTAMLTMAVVLTMVTDGMPRSAQGIPLLGLYVLCEMLLSAVFTLAAVWVMFMHSRVNHGGQMPKWTIWVVETFEKLGKTGKKGEDERGMQENVNENELDMTQRVANSKFGELQRAIAEVADTAREIERILRDACNHERVVAKGAANCDALDTMFLVVGMVINLLLTLIVIVWPLLDL